MSFPSSQLRSLLLLGLSLAMVWESPTRAQDTCRYATIRVDSIQYVDQSAVCEAAKPWADSGYEVLVFLTDARPANEDAWYTLLDRVEVEAGLRDLNQADSFDLNGIALEVTTAIDLPYAVSVTYGEDLYNTPLDTNAAALDAIKNSVGDKIATRDATWALTTGLEAMADLVDLGEGIPSTATPLPLQDPSAVTVTADRNGAAGFAGMGLVLAGGGTVGALALRRRRRKQLAAHLDTLQSRIANLLMGCEQLLTGNTPNSMVSYQLFVESDGERYPQLTTDVSNWLTEARQALDQAFQVHAHLQEDADQLKQPLHKRVEAWELLYLAFVGKSERIRTLSDEELQTLLNPAFVVSTGNTALSQGLVVQLEAIQGKIKGTPLKVTLQQADPQGVDELGILGRVEKVDATIGRLQWAVTEAPKDLAAVQNRRQALERDLPASLQLAPAEAFGGIDRLIAIAEAALNRDRLYLKVVEDCQDIEKALALIETLNETFQRYDSQQTDIQGLIAAGYRPPQLHVHQATTQQLLEQLQQKLQASAYSAIPDLLNKLEAASQKSRQAAIDWQEHHQRNQNTLESLTNESDRLVNLAQHEATAAWNSLQSYPDSNWTDLGPKLDRANTILQEVCGKKLPYLKQQNDFAVQAFAKVTQGNETVTSLLQEAESQLQAVLARYELIQAAEANLSRELATIENHLQQTTEFVTHRFLGLLATNKPDSRLQAAHSDIGNAYDYAQAREYLHACEARDQSLRVILTVYLDKMRERKSKVRSLVMDSDARGRGRTEFDEASNLMASDATIRQATGQKLFTQYANAGIAWEHLKTAERLAQQQIRRTKAARRRSSSSSSSRSYRSSSSSYSSSRSRSSSSSRRSSSSRSRGSSSRSSSSRGRSRRR
ncbi:MAG: hypothetical protein AAGE59_00495 [Cyanobacteria bacterium P01_F01_bin.86]